MSKIKHGADLLEISQKYNFKPEDIMDFSSNINPFGASPKALSYIKTHPGIISVYPDPLHRLLLKAIGKYIDLSFENILAGDGATEFISAFISFAAPKRPMIIFPCYSEYLREVNKNNPDKIFKTFLNETDDFKFDVEKLISECNSNSIDLLILCNPNNPTGSILSRDEIEKILKNTDTYVMIDETYMEFSDTEKFSAFSLVEKYDKLFVLRGTSKFFASPGLRLGYAATSDKTVRNSILSHSNLWNLNIFAENAGKIMFEDTDYIQKTKLQIQKERKYLLSELSKISALKVYPTFSNFILVKIKEKNLTAGELYDRLIIHKMAIRDCSSFEGLDPYFFRVCVLDEKADKLLISKLNEIF